MKKHLLLFAILSMVSLIFAKEWTTWRGPNRNGVLNHQNFAIDSASSKINILWKTNIGRGHAQCAVKNGKLYTFGTTLTIAGKDTTAEDKVYCLNAKTGKKIWSYSYPSENIYFVGPRTSPVIDKKNLYTLSSAGDLYCFNLKTGSVNWHKNLAKDFNVIQPSWGFAGSPVIYENKLILTAGENGISLDKNNGQLLWHSNLDVVGSLSSPYLIEHKGKTYGLISDEKNMHCVDIETGKKQWSYRYVTTNDPILHDGNLFLSGDSRAGVVMLKLTKEGPKEVWKEKSMRGGFQNKVVVDGYAYGFATVKKSDQLHCINLTDGKLKWQQALEDPFGALMAVNNKLIIISGQGKLIIADADPTGFDPILSAQVIEMEDNTGLKNIHQCQCWIDPIMVDGRFYVRNNFGNLVCLTIE